MTVTLLNNDLSLDVIVKKASQADLLSLKKAILLELLQEDFSNSVSNLSELIEQYYENPARFRESLSKLVNTFHSPDRAQSVLTSLEKDFEDVERIEGDGFDSLISRTISAFPISSPALLLVGLQFNAATTLTRGITSGLSGSLFTMLKSVWEKAIQEIHPYQIGPTNQGTIHCITNLKMLNRLNSLATLDMDARRSFTISKKVTIEEGVALSIAAALHDIWKAHYTTTSNHHLEGSKFIRSNPSLLGVSFGYEIPVSEIVKNHDGSQNLISLPDTSVSSGQSLRMSELCALFRLADVLDITFSRVSNIYKEMNLSGLPDRQKDALLSREKVKSVILRHPYTYRTNDDEISIIYSPPLINELKNTVAIENSKLESVTSTVTLANGSSLKLTDGCNAKTILRGIRIAHNLELRRS